MDFHPRDLPLLVSLDVLLSECSVTMAARRLGISQPAMSAQLARLRRLFGDELLVGNAHGMTPTRRAEEIREPLGAIIFKLRGLLAEVAAFDPMTDSRHFRVAGSDMSLSVLLPLLMPLVAARAPRVTLEMVPLAVDSIASGMERGELDFAITSAGNTPQSFPARLLTTQRFSMIWRSDHPELRGPATLSQFCRLRHVVATVAGGGIPDGVDEALRQQGLSRIIAARVPNFLLVPDIIRASDMVAVVPGRLALSRPEGLAVAPPPLELPGIEIYLSWHRRLHRDAATEWMRRLISESLADEPFSPEAGPDPAR